MFDILIYLFETYVSGDMEAMLEPDRDSLKSELVNAGFADHDIDDAFLWLESLATTPANVPPGSRALRVFDGHEVARLDIACRGYIQHLENLGILNAQQREWVVDRLLALTTDEIDIEQVKWVVLMVLFSQPDEAAAYSRMEDLVFAEQTEHAVH